MEKRSGRILQLDGLRAVALLSVMANHLYSIKLLWMGVDLFFVLSGFLITGILYEQKKKSFRSYIGGFYQRRALRILPSYLVLLAITVCLFGPGYLRYWYFYLGGMNLLTIFHVPFPATLPVWSLAVEEQFYFLWPLAVYLLTRKHLIWFSAGLMVLAPTLRWVFTPIWGGAWDYYTLLPFRMDLLAAGACIALLWPALQERLEASGGNKVRWRITAGSLGSLAIALLSLQWLGRHGYNTHSSTQVGNTVIYSVALVIVSSVFLMALVGFGKRLLISWPLVWIGRISYSMYLFHLTAIYLLGHRPLPVVALTMGYALVMWFVLEKPVMRLGQQTERNRKPATA